MARCLPSPLVATKARAKPPGASSISTPIWYKSAIREPMVSPLMQALSYNVQGV